MAYYHVAIHEKEKPAWILNIELDLTEDDIKKLGAQYSMGCFFLCGKWINVSDVDFIEIRESSLHSTKIKHGILGLDEKVFFNSQEYPNVTRTYISRPQAPMPPPGEIRCADCGYDNRGNASFCGGCGKRLRGDTTKIY